MKQLILHAGLPKTGSSALQVFFARNRDALRRQSIDYFRLGEFDRGCAGMISSGNGNLLARSLLPAGDAIAVADPEAHIAAVKAAIAASDCSTCLISSELLAECDLARLGCFIDALQVEGVAVKSVFYVRAQDQLISSAYIQTVKRSHLRDAPEAYARQIYRLKPFMKYATFYKSLCGILGSGNVIVRSYESAIKGSGLCRSFLHAIGAAETDFIFDRNDVNVALSPGQIAVMRELNKFRPSIRLADQLVENTAAAGVMSSGDTHNILAPGTVREIRPILPRRTPNWRICASPVRTRFQIPRAQTPPLQTWMKSRPMKSSTCWAGCWSVTTNAWRIWNPGLMAMIIIWRGSIAPAFRYASAWSAKLRRPAPSACA